MKNSSSMTTSWDCLTSYALRPEPDIATSILSLSWCRLTYTESSTHVRSSVMITCSISSTKSSEDCFLCTLLTLSTATLNPAICSLYWFYYWEQKLRSPDLWLGACSRLRRRRGRENWICCYPLVSCPRSHPQCQRVHQGSRYLVNWVHPGWTVWQTTPLPRRGFPRSSAAHHLSIRHTFFRGYEIHR